MSPIPGNTMQETRFRQIFEEYKNRVFGYVLAITHSHQDAEEITQELFIKLWSSRELLPEIKDIDKYIFVMAKNRTFNYLRQMANNEKLLDEVSKRMVASEQDADVRALEANYQKLLEEAMNRLSPQRKLAYELSRHRGMDLTAIAQQMKISKNTAKNHLTEALKQIRAYLAQNGIGMVLLFEFISKLNK
ncbi:MAG TPA: RNA polymerase sigma-70 factor [Chitinophagaceae bacterium]|jgi:RNA polymerase sigma-70 factor (ECF subfamily)|nr:RNA polymerase sigma-70 factor [Chitinophagaceae bacterium]